MACNYLRLSRNQRAGSHDWTFVLAHSNVHAIIQPGDALRFVCDCGAFKDVTAFREKDGDLFAD